MNRLFYGDDLDVLQQHIADESVDLVCLDPPFNSNASCNAVDALIPQFRSFPRGALP